MRGKIDGPGGGTVQTGDEGAENRHALGERAAYRKPAAQTGIERDRNPRGDNDKRSRDRQRYETAGTSGPDAAMPDYGG